MRTYANTLLFSGVLENIPSTVDGNIYSATQLILHLPTLVVEADCGTLLGSPIPLSLGLVGYIEVATGQQFTTPRINYLLGTGVSTTYVRSTSSCISKGGICQTCYAGSSNSAALPPVGSLIEIEPNYMIGNQYFFGTGTQTIFPLSYDISKTIGNIVYVNDTLVPFNYTISGGTLQFANPPGFNQTIAIRSILRDTSVFTDVLSKSYSGDILGANPRATSFPLPVRRSLYEQTLAGSVLQGVQNTVKALPTVPEYVQNYALTIKSPLEATLFYIYNYLIFT